MLYLRSSVICLHRQKGRTQTDCPPRSRYLIIFPVCRSVTHRERNRSRDALDLRSLCWEPLKTHTWKQWVLISPVWYVSFLLCLGKWQRWIWYVGQALRTSYFPCDYMRAGSVIWIPDLWIQINLLQVFDMFSNSSRRSTSAFILFNTSLCQAAERHQKTWAWTWIPVCVRGFKNSP